MAGRRACHARDAGSSEGITQSTERRTSSLAAQGQGANEIACPSEAVTSQVRNGDSRGTLEVVKAIGAV